MDNTGYVQGFDISSNGEMFAFGDSAGVIHQWTDQVKESHAINPFSRPTDLFTPMQIPSTRLSQDR